MVHIPQYQYRNIGNMTPGSWLIWSPEYLLFSFFPAPRGGAHSPRRSPLPGWPCPLGPSPCKLHRPRKAQGRSRTREDCGCNCGCTLYTYIYIRTYIYIYSHYIYIYSWGCGCGYSFVVVAGGCTVLNLRLRLKLAQVDACPPEDRPQGLIGLLLQVSANGVGLRILQTSGWQGKR